MLHPAALRCPYLAVVTPVWVDTERPLAAAAGAEIAKIAIFL